MVCVVVGELLVVIVKINVEDGFFGGLMVEDVCVLVEWFEVEGIDGFIISGGLISCNFLFLMWGV